MELTSLTLVEASQLLHSGQITPLELTHAFQERIARLEPLLNCFITQTPELALNQARQAEENLQELGDAADWRASPLLGIPIGLKDLFETKGIRTTAGSTFFREYIPARDAKVVARLKKAGTVTLGKLNLHEIALGVTTINPHFGVCRNPWDPTRITGGSSGGSGAALAASMCLGALGSDSGGSIRIPASLCGVVGLKPTYGRVSLQGVIPLSWHTDHAGPMAKSVEDAAILFDAIAGYDPDDPASIRHQRVSTYTRLRTGLRGVRVALAADEFFSKTNSQVWDAVENSLQVFKDLGAQVVRTTFPGMLEAGQANLVMVTSDAAAYHHERLVSHPEGFGEDILRRLQSGAAHPIEDYIQARRTQTVLHRKFEQFFLHHDILIMPTTPVAAPPIEGPDALEQARLLTRYTAPFNLTGLPAISLPCGFTDQGLPIGLQIIARPWNELGVLQAAYAFEQATDWRKRSPLIEKA